MRTDQNITNRQLEVHGDCSATSISNCRTKFPLYFAAYFEFFNVLQHSYVFINYYLLI